MSATWLRTVRLGLVVGLVQVALNQGDHWLSGHITVRLVAKSISLILFAMLVVLVASASARAESLREAPSSS